MVELRSASNGTKRAPGSHHDSKPANHLSCSTLCALPWRQFTLVGGGCLIGGICISCHGSNWFFSDAVGVFMMMVRRGWMFHSFESLPLHHVLEHLKAAFTNHDWFKRLRLFQISPSLEYSAGQSKVHSELFQVVVADRISPSQLLSITHTLHTMKLSMITILATMAVAAMAHPPHEYHDRRDVASGQNLYRRSKQLGSLHCYMENANNGEACDATQCRDGGGYCSYNSETKRCSMNDMRGPSSPFACRGCKCKAA